MLFSLKKKIRYDSWYYKFYLYYNLYIKEKIFIKRKSYSQFGEDLFISEFFEKKSGIYVDIGCFHPLKYSNTALLHNRGWNGYNIDINRTSIDLFKIARPNDKNFNICLSIEENQEVTFYTEHLFSSINSLYADHLKKFKVKEIINFKVLTDRFDNLVKEKFDFLNIDCEGHDFEIIKLIDLDKYRPLLVCIEISEKNEQEIKNYFSHFGYELINKKTLTVFFKKVK